MVNRNKLEPQEVEAVPDEHVEEIYQLWFDTCLPDEVKEQASTERVATQHRFAARLLIAQWGMDTARKAIKAIVLSPEHDGSRHRDEHGNRLIRRDLTTARLEAPNLVDYWDNKK